MAGVLNLQKNDILDLRKAEPGLKHVMLGAGWDVAKKGFFNLGADYDLDLIALLLDSNDRLINRGVIYFGNLRGEGIYLHGDNRTGAGDGDDEKISVDLDKLPSRCEKVIFALNIYDAVSRKQNFSKVKNAYIRILNEDNGNKEICRYNLSEDGGNNTALLFAELQRVNGSWQFKAKGELLQATVKSLADMYNSMGSTNNNAQNGGILNLNKNDILDLTKKNPGLKRVMLGAGWDISNNGSDFDLDIAAFLLDANNKFNTVSNVIFFNNKQGQGIALSGDNRTGAGDGDDETINIELDKIDLNIAKIVFVVTIHEAMAKRQTFGMINNSYVRLVDLEQNGKEICRFNLKENGSTATSIIFAELIRTGAEWQFKAVGEGKIADLNGVLALYQ